MDSSPLVLAPGLVLLLPSGRQSVNQPEAVRIIRSDQHHRNDSAADGLGLPSRSGNDEQRFCSGDDDCSINDRTPSVYRIVAQQVTQSYSQPSFVECRLSVAGIQLLLPSVPPVIVPGMPSTAVGSSLPPLTANNSLNSSMKSSLGSGFKCSKCGIKCSSSRSLRQHEGHAHGGPTCSACGQQFPSLSLLMSHVISQEKGVVSKPSRQQSGSFCGTTSAHGCQQQALMPYRAGRATTGWNKKLRRLAKLGFHDRTATVSSDAAQRQHPCDFCGDEFLSLTDLVTHQKSEHPDWVASPVAPST